MVDRLIIPVAIVVAVALVMTCAFGLPAFGGSAPQCSWRPEDIAYKDAKDALKAEIDSTKDKLVKLQEARSRHGMRDSDYGQSLLVFLTSLLNSLKETLLAGAKVDRADYSDLLKAKQGAKQGKEALRKAAEKIRTNRRENLEAFRISSLGAIVESELSKSHGEGAVPFPVNGQLSAFQAVVNKTLGSVHERLTNEYGKLEAAGDDFERLEDIIRGSLEFKSKMSDSIGEIAGAMVTLKDIKTMPDIQKLMDRQILATNELDDGVGLLGILTGEFLNTVFRPANTSGPKVVPVSSEMSPQDAREKAWSAFD